VGKKERGNGERHRKILNPAHRRTKGSNKGKNKKGSKTAPGKGGKSWINGEKGKVPSIHSKKRGRGNTWQSLRQRDGGEKQDLIYVREGKKEGSKTPFPSGGTERLQGKKKGTEKGKCFDEDRGEEAFEIGCRGGNSWTHAQTKTSGVIILHINRLRKKGGYHPVPGGKTKKKKAQQRFLRVKGEGRKTGCKTKSRRTCKAEEFF